MKRLICILASSALLGACEQKTQVVTPAAQADGTTVPSPPAKSETGAKTTTTNTVTTGATPATNTETKTESTTTTTTSSPNP